MKRRRSVPSGIESSHYICPTSSSPNLNLEINTFPIKTSYVGCYKKTKRHSSPLSINCHKHSSPMLMEKPEILRIQESLNNGIMLNSLMGHLLALQEEDSYNGKDVKLEIIKPFGDIKENIHLDNFISDVFFRCSNSLTLILFFSIKDNGLLDIINNSIQLNNENLNIISISSNLENTTCNNTAIPIINDFKNLITKNFDVLDPLSGGVYPLNCIFLFDSLWKLRLKLNVIISNSNNKKLMNINRTNSTFDDELMGVLLNCLNYLKLEMDGQY
ncbi:hypothetical protein PACTADRAFT_2304 [Pachysolen tannophilus NRRL Y-2460]|uniref:Uncharacterized protein n=1 Tax=Pachysolen tannophilus NRRL Y-2460 TaxID=669874 RepID=A0A1E4TW63_PACTA|nr:hypothetical protein PACTADRAFT_2304 [Pachysolen tannophilus NRRL Y-2460]